VNALAYKKFVRFLLFAVWGLSCGTTLPRRYVVEENLGEFSYRRFQRMAQAELPLPDDPGQGYTAAYIRHRDTGPVTLSTAFVSVYRKEEGLEAKIRKQLDNLEGYSHRDIELEGEHVIEVHGAPEESWILWISGRHVIKLSAPSQASIPEAMLERYFELYPSDVE